VFVLRERLRKNEYASRLRISLRCFASLDFVSALFYVYSFASLRFVALFVCGASLRFVVIISLLFCLTSLLLCSILILRCYHFVIFLCS